MSLLGASLGTVFLNTVIVPILYNLRVTSLNEVLCVVGVREKEGRGEEGTVWVMMADVGYL